MLQSNQVLSFFRPRENGGDWSQKDLAEFYRVEAALISSGVSIATDRGLSDEGDPWFVFFRQDNEEVIVHFARIDGEYVVVSNIAEGVVRGRNFQALIRELLETHPYVLPKQNSRRQTVYLHPATLLAALIVTGYVKSAELNDGSDDHAGRSEKGFGWLFNRHDLVAFSAIVIAAVWDSLVSDSSVNKFADMAWFDDGRGSADGSIVAAGALVADGNINFDDFAPVSGASHDHSILASATLNLGEQSAAANPEGWMAASADSKAFVLQLPSHSAESDQAVSNHDVHRLEKDSDFKSGAWHSEQDASELSLANVQTDTAAASGRLGSSTAPAVVSAASDTHASSNTASTAPAFDVVNSSSAVASLSSALHIDPQSLHPVEITAANLSSAVQATLLELNQEFGSSAGSQAFTNPVANVTMATQLTDDSIHEFDAAAQHILDVFLRDTGHYRIESFGHDLLIVDTNMSHFASNEFSVETWKMSDGSTLSILGIVAHQAELLAAA